MLAAIGFITLAIVVGMVLLRARSAKPLSATEASAVDAGTRWATDVQEAIAHAEQELRWITRDQCLEWAASRPARVSARTLKRLDPVVRSAVEFVCGDLSLLVATVNGRIRERALVERKKFVDSIESQPLTDEQATAVVTMDNRVQVVAAAGSGKTSVMVARAAYAIRFGFVPADKVLLLAFNRDAAEQLQSRLEGRFAAAGMDSTGFAANTFHAFGLSCIGRATGRKPRLAGWLDGGQDVATVSRIVDELRDSDVGFRFKWDLYRLLFARMGENSAEAQPDAYDKKSRTTGFGTMRGEVVKSEGERLIADWLFLNGITYEYERPYSHDVADESHSQYRPDFFYPDVDVWHEHWAIGPDGEPPAAFVGYAESMRWKKQTHRRFGTTLLETTWTEILDTTGFGPLHDQLAERGITFDWNPDRARGTEAVSHEDLAKLIRTFMAHVKSNGFTREVLEERWGRSRRSYRSRVFLDIYWPIHEAWQRRLEQDQSIDFEDMLIEAARHVEAGADMGYEMVLVDEFQDASPARARLARALVDRPHRYLMTVGDDWQAINRFAGADISVMTDFNSWFGEGPTLRLQTTFRCTQTIADTAAAFVQKNPRQIAKTVRSFRSDAGVPVSLIRLESEDQITDAIGAWLADLSAKVSSATVDILGRYGFERKLLPRAPYPNLTVTFRTAHSSKGLEADYVLIPRMVSGTYGFPSEIVDDPVLRLVMSDADRFPHGEERRLLYVALTRARKAVTLMTVSGRESSFVAELAKAGALAESPLSTAVPVVACPACGQGALVARTGPYSEFLGCTRFPACRHTQRLS
ncbi:UvrD-helicase domain-containing protein [Nocardioides sp. CER19]|uniref:UvrD-helicase domain-containing protein n=1 Tax=Nocardioides sp. CER19 TaxID=3038538 RepID=UPI0024489807|nr:UvrD-helicase domain-containing protein [Nocardioides sp. CER19]MDH2414336.1 UvrD-helicase domain-containing protein [Nocardioides sp. CER19]